MLVDLMPTIPEVSPEFEHPTLAAGEGRKDGNHRQGVFGGGSRIGSMMDDRGGRGGRNRGGRRRPAIRMLLRARNAIRAGWPRGWTYHISSN